MDKIAAALAGKKTYIAAALAIVTALSGVANGDLSTADAFNTIVTAILGSTIRHGVSKS